MRYDRNGNLTNGNLTNGNLTNGNLRTLLKLRSTLARRKDTVFSMLVIAKSTCSISAPAVSLSKEISPMSPPTFAAACL